MTQSIEQFKQQVLQDLALQERFKAVTNSQEFVNLAIQLGQELGYSFTAAEVETALAQSGIQLSDNQLEAVAGGGELGRDGAPGSPGYSDYGTTCESG